MKGTIKMKQNQRRRQQRSMQDKFLRFTDEEIQASNRFLATIPSMGDDAHIENHVSPLCITDSTNRMESCYIEKKEQVELLQAEVARLSAIIERRKTELIAAHVELYKFNAISIELHKSRNQAYKHLESCENSLNFQTERFDELSQKVLSVLEIINNPDNNCVQFSNIEQIKNILGEVQS